MVYHVPTMHTPRFEASLAHYSKNKGPLYIHNFLYQRREALFLLVLLVLVGGGEREGLWFVRGSNTISTTPISAPLPSPPPLPPLLLKIVSIQLDI